MTNIIKKKRSIDEVYKPCCASPRKRSITWAEETQVFHQKDTIGQVKDYKSDLWYSVSNLIVAFLVLYPIDLSHSAFIICENRKRTMEASNWIGSGQFKILGLLEVLLACWTQTFASGASSLSTLKNPEWRRPCAGKTTSRLSLTNKSGRCYMVSLTRRGSQCSFQSSRRRLWNEHKH